MHIYYFQQIFADFRVQFDVRREFNTRNQMVQSNFYSNPRLILVGNRRSTVIMPRSPNFINSICFL